MNYHNLIIKELESQSSFQYGYYDECDEDEKENILTTIDAIEFSINYFNIRFNNNLKHYNNNEVKAYDLFSAKKALEYFNVYTEEFYFLNKEKTHYNYVFRNILRSVINVLYLKINKYKKIKYYYIKGDK